MTAQLLVIYFAVISAFQFDFEGGNIEDHIDHKVSYLRQFSDEEKVKFCKNGDYLSCKILFLAAMQNNDDSAELQNYLDLLPPEHSSTGVYLYLIENWRDIPIEKLKQYMAVLPSNLSKKLYGTYLKKLYLSGNVSQFMSDYRQINNSELTTYYVRELLKKSPLEAFKYLRSLKIVFHEGFYDSIGQDVEKYSSSLSKESYNEFRIWMLEFNYRKVRYTQAVNMALKWFPRKRYSDSFEWRAHLYRAMSHTKKREHSKAAAIYKALEKHEKNESLDDGDLYRFYHNYGYSEAALGNNERSIELYLKGFERFANKDEGSAGSFLYMAADMSRLAGDLVQAGSLYERYVNEYSELPKVSIAEFLLFWINYKRGEFENSKKYLSKIISSSHNMSYNFQRATYWLGRVYEKTGDEKDAESVFCLLKNGFPASFYGSMAASRIKSREIVCNEKFEVSPDKDQFTKFKDTEMIPQTGWMIASMVINDAGVMKKVLRNVSSTVKENGSEIDRLTASYLAKKTGSHALAAGMIRSISNFSSTSKEYFKLQYTIAFEEEILSHCDFYGVPPMFVFSIARQESLFSVGAVSSSFAIGLLQLLPTTAQLLANSENYGKITPEILKKPLTNVRFGVRFLSDLLKKFDGSIPLAAASYNAGPGRITKWIKQAPEKEIDEFIEDIPIFQTRNYVKKVMGNYAVYNYIFEGKVYDGLEFKLPAM